MPTLTRRNLIQTAGALGTLSLNKAYAEFFQPSTNALYPASSLVTCCGICDSACGIRATVGDGVVKFLQGLPEDFQGGGALCAKGTSGAATMYDPDRLKYPMRRTNPNKDFGVDPGWVRISWDEALETIAARYKAILGQYGNQALLAVARPKPELLLRFIKSLGMTRVDHNDTCYGVEKVIQKYTVGPKSFAHDFENSKYVLLFGWDQAARAKIVFARGIHTAKSNGAKVVCFNPHRTATARFADEYYAIRPGSDLAAALAIIQVLLEENLYNKEFVENYTNFPQYESQIREHFRQYTPEWAEPLCDIPAADLRRIAREFGTSGPSIVPVHKKTPATNYSNASQLCHALSILNILAGTLERPGGKYSARMYKLAGLDAIYPPPAYPAPPAQRVDGREKLPLANEGDFGMFTTLADGMTRVYPGRIKGIFWYGYGMLSFPQPARIAAALRSVDFTVVVDILPTDVTYFADIVLPNAMYLEGNDLVERDYAAKMPQVVARQALVPPLFEAKTTGWLCVELGKRLAPEYFKTQSGAWISPSTVLDEKLKRAGLAESFADFKKTGFATKQAEFVPTTTFGAPGGKCQIYVPQFAAKGYDALPAWRQKRAVPSSEYPYYLVTYLPGSHKRNSTQNNRILNEIMPENSALINPALASKLGIVEGQKVRIRSKDGAVELPAHLTETLRPDCVKIAHGFGHISPMLTAASGKGVRDNDLMATQTPEQMLAAGNFAGSGAIMDAVVAIEPMS